MRARGVGVVEHRPLWHAHEIRRQGDRRGAEGAQTALQEQFHKNLTLEEGETMAVTILKQVMEEKLDVNNVEVAAVKLPTPPPGLSDPVTAACHYVPGHKVNKPKFTPYSKTELEAVLARVTPAPAN